MYPSLLILQTKHQEPPVAHDSQLRCPRSPAAAAPGAMEIHPGWSGNGGQAEPTASAPPTPAHQAFSTQGAGHPQPLHQPSWAQGSSCVIQEAELFFLLQQTSSSNDNTSQNLRCGLITSIKHTHLQGEASTAKNALDFAAKGLREEKAICALCFYLSYY